MKIAIIGAGPAGLAAIRHCLEASIECVAFEQTGKIGGIWNYVEADVDENDLPVHSSMYKGLTANLPKELMEYENFSYKEKERAFLPQEEVLEYIHSFAEYFNLLPHVKFYHQVLLVDPLPDEQWTVKVKNLKTQEIAVDTYNGIIVCNGHYFDPLYPIIPGMDNFNGRSAHSHNYRTPDKYKEKKVLILGAGPSGIDICKLIVNMAKKVYISFGNERFFTEPCHENAVAKPKIKYLSNNTAVFEDETEEEIDDIIYCTGYKYTFPFFNENCQISVDDNWVKPLYKHLINIEHPSMAIINLISSICPFPIFGLQIRFYLALLKGHFHVSKEEMYEDLRKDRETRDQNSLPKKRAHMFGKNQLAYCEDLARVAKIQRIPRVIGKIFLYFIENNFPKTNFKILNDEEFEVFPPK